MLEDIWYLYYYRFITGICKIKKFKNSKTNGVPILKQNYPQWNIIDLAEKEKITVGTLGQRKNPIIICDIDTQIENTSLGFFDNQV